MRLPQNNDKPAIHRVTEDFARSWGRWLLPLFLMSVVPASPAAGTVEVIALFEGKAILVVDGQRRMLGAGQALGPVELVSADPNSAVVSINGERRELFLQPGRVEEVDESHLPAPPSNSVILYADANGFFHSAGTINGRSVRFLVDTGANSVALSRRDAEQLNIDLDQGQRGFATTASGVVPMTSVVLDSVSIGGIELFDVEAGVIEGVFPEQPLLGTSFLSRLNIQQSGTRMELRKR